MIIVGFYTENTQYEKEAKEWLESFKGYDTCLYKVANLGSWELNCAQKSRILRYAIDDLEEDILYLDVDARIERSFTEEETPLGDLPGFVVWNQTWGSHKEELLSGTIFFPNNNLSREILDDWIHEQENNPREWDQRTLQKVVFSAKYPYYKMNLNWCAIQKFMKLQDPIIVHGQASRRLKGTIK